MGEVKRTQLNENQLLRLYNHCNDEGKFKSATLCEVIGTKIVKFEIEYYNMAKESFYPDEDTFDYIMNGVKVTRGGN